MPNSTTVKPCVLYEALRDLRRKMRKAARAQKGSGNWARAEKRVHGQKSFMKHLWRKVDCPVAAEFAGILERNPYAENYPKACENCRQINHT